MKSSKAGIIGLGLLGSALARQLMNFGFEITGFDIDPECRKRFLNEGGQIRESIGELTSSEKVVILSLPTSAISREVIDEILSQQEKPEIIIDTTTGDPDEMIEIGDRLKAEGIHYMDATVGGSSEQVTSRDVILMIGGEENVIKECELIWKSWSGKVFHTGPVGSGARMKLVMNLVLGLNRAVLAEGLSFAGSLDLPLEKTLAILKASPAFSGVMETKGKKMIQHDFVPPQARLSQHLKDVRLILKTARENSQKTPFSELHESILNELSQSGSANEDNSSVIRYFENK